MNKRYVGVILILILILAGVALLSMYVLKVPSAEQQRITETKAANLASQYVIQNKITTLSDNCIAEYASAPSTEDTYFIDVREVHNTACGGDPQTGPRIASVEVDAHTGVVSEPGLQWEGNYEYDESAPPDLIWAYVLSIKPSGKSWHIDLNIDGHETETRILATAAAKGSSLDVYFDSYGPDNIHPQFKKGDHLFTLTHTAAGVLITWDKLQPNLEADAHSQLFTEN